MVTEVMDTVSKQDTYIKAAPEDVYDAVSTGKAINTWFTRQSEWEDRAGSAMVWGWENWGPDHVEMTVTGKVLVAESPRRFVFEWGQSNVTTVEIDIEEAPGGSVVRVRQHGYEDSVEGRELLASCAAGWGQAMTMLKFFLETGALYGVVPVEEETRHD